MSGRWMLAGVAALAAGCAYTGPAIDAHAHFESDAAPGRIHPKLSGKPGALLEAMDEAGVARTVLLVVPAGQDLAAARVLHDQVAAVVKKSPDRFIAVGLVPPSYREAGFRGVKLSPTRLDLATPEVTAFVTRAIALKLVVYIEGWWAGSAHETGKLALAFPQGRFVLTHMGGIRFDDVLVFRVLELYPFYPRNVWFDLSGVAPLYANSPYAEQLRWICRQVGTDRILFGSDFPLTELPAALAAVRRLGFTGAEEQQIFHDNAEALFFR
jgi:uncharacterized protein